MNRRDLLRAGLLAPVAARAEDFEAYKESQRRDFQAYKERLREAFAAYKRAHAAAFEAFREELEAAWRRPELTDRRKWVEYSGDRRTQRVVDFEADEIRLKGIEPEAGRAEEAAWSRERFRRELAALLREDFATAFQRDPVAQGVERSLEEAPVAVERGEPSRRPVLGARLGAKGPPGPEEADEQAEALMAKAPEAERERVEAGSGWARAISVPLPEASASERAREYLAPARRYAAEQEVADSLVLAVMHTESAFNPLARSPIPAYGLMQIVPESAGRDATRLLMGRPRVLAPSYLYDPENNIRIGAAYLRLLYHRYMAAVREPESRLYCAIAGYNTGPGNVARTFTGGTDMAAAAERINGRSGAEVYRTLVRELPYEETRHYLERVARRMRAYRDL